MSGVFNSLRNSYFAVKTASLQHLFLFMVAMLISLGFTTWYVTEYNSYKVIGEEWLTNSNFTQGLNGWRFSPSNQVTQDDSGIVTLSAATSDKYVVLYQEIPVNFKEEDRLNASATLLKPPIFLQLSGVAQTRGVVRGEKEWNLGRFLLTYYDKEGNRIAYNSLFLPLGDSRWSFYKRAFELPPEVHKVRVSAVLSKSVGTVQVKKVGLVPVLLKPEVVYFKIVGVILWLGLIVWLIWRYLICIGKEAKKGWVLFIFFMAIVWFFNGFKILSAIQLHTLAYPIISHTLVLKWDGFTHLIFFFILTFVFVACLHCKRGWQVVLDLILLGLFIECLQVFIDGRTADVSDLAFDYIGIAFGLILALLWLKIRPNVKSDTV